MSECHSRCVDTCHYTGKRECGNDHAPTIPDVLYAVSARVQIETPNAHPDGVWRHTVDLPTFYLDSRVQGIVSADHASDIVRAMLASLGHADVSIQTCATARDRS